MPRPNIARALVAGLLIGSSVLFSFATSAERHKEHAELRAEAAGHAEAPSSTTTVPTTASVPTSPTTVTAPPAVTGGGDPDRGHEGSSPTGNVATTLPAVSHDSDGGAETATTSAAPAAADTPGENAGADQHGGARAEKSETLLGVKTESTATTAAAVALSLVAAGAALWVRRRWLWVIVAFAAALAALDGREAAHQAKLGRGGLVTAAVILAVTHGAAAIVAVGVAASRRLETATRQVAS